jgi:hypothetical protein
MMVLNKPGEWRVTGELVTLQDVTRLHAFNVTRISL